MENELIVSFIVGDFLSDPKEVTNLLKITPSSIHRRGEIKAKTSLRYKSNLWILCSDIQHSLKLEDHLSRLLSKLPTNLDCLKSLEGDWTAEFSCVIYLVNSEPELHLPSKLVRAIADLNASIDLDIYPII